jgi:hypothetical protein
LAAGQGRQDTPYIASDNTSSKLGVILNPECCGIPVCDGKAFVSWAGNPIPLAFSGVDGSGNYVYSAKYATVVSSISVSPLFGPPPADTATFISISGNDYTVIFKTAGHALTPFSILTGFGFACQGETTIVEQITQFTVA